MATIRCPKCGKNNSDLQDVCQFCEAPLKSDSVLRIGDAPTRKDTGELESVLPAWLRDVRQQSKSSTEDATPQEVPQPKVEKEGTPAPNLLAGLASQSSEADEDDIPDWLASINPVADSKPAMPSTPASEPESDFFAQFRQQETPPAKPAREEPASAPAKPEAPSSDSPVDELSQWFADASEQPGESVETGSGTQRAVESDWLSGFGAPASSQPEPAPREKEDLSWLHNLEESSKQTGDLPAPKAGSDWMADFEAPSSPVASGSQEDLSWLDNLAGIEESQQPAATSPFVQPAAKEEDLSWLNNLGAPEAQPFDAAPEQPASAQPFVSEEDLSWLNKLGQPEEPSQPPSPAATPSSQEDLSWLSQLGETSEPSQPASPAATPPSQEDLSWLSQLGGTSEPSQPAAPAATPSSQEDLSWLSQLGETSEPSQQSVPAFTPPAQDDLNWLNELGGQPSSQSTPPFTEPESTAQVVPPFQQEEAEPDWLKGALETPATPTASDATSLDWLTSKDQPAELPAEQTAQSSPFTDIFAAPPSEPAPLSNQDLDSLFSAEMPDWLSRAEPTTGEPVSREAAQMPAESAESLAPVELPSWVQAMRPMEAVISETAAGGEEEPEEQEGPLAGLRGVIPGLSVGLSSKPKAISLKLQATDEQQASAALLERILGSETNPRALITPSTLWSQRGLRIGLTAVFLIVLGLVTALRSTAMPIPSGALPDDMQPAATIVENLPEGGRVLVIVDYEPALAGEMEAVAGPVLAHMTSLRRSHLSFVSSSSNGPGLVERLLINTKINQPDGLGYVAGEQYLNLGYLPGGSAGILGFVKSPGRIIPAADESLSKYVAVVLMTDHAESGRVWVEQLSAQKFKDPLLTNQPLLVIASAQADPLLQPYVSSQQINGIVSGLADAARYESVIVTSTSPKTARSYWDAFGIGLAMAIALIVIGSLWSLFTGIRARRLEAEQG